MKSHWLDGLQANSYDLMKHKETEQANRIYIKPLEFFQMLTQRQHFAESVKHKVKQAHMELKGQTFVLKRRLL